jgi:hypothetical protein
MKMMIFFILSVFNSQQDSFLTAVNKYKNATLDNPKVMSESDVKCIFKNNFEGNGFSGGEILKIDINRASVTILVNQFIPAGAGGNTISIYSFALGGLLISFERIVSMNAEDEFPSKHRMEFINDSIIWITDYSRQEVKSGLLKTRETHFYYVFGEEGYIEIENLKYFNPAGIFQSSSRIYDLQELGSLCTEDLDIMRNEIFAKHGYIFKTEKWRKYFENKEWYKPEFEDVTDKLTAIEVVNLYHLLNASKK